MLEAKMKKIQYLHTSY